MCIKLFFSFLHFIKGVSDGLWTEDKIEAYVGKMGEIKVATKFRYVTLRMDKDKNFRP